MITHTIIAKNTTSGTITFPDLGGFYVVASGTETLSDHFKNQYLETSTDLVGSVQSGDIVINDGEKDLTVQQGLFHVKDLSFQKILEYLAALTVVGLADTPDDYSETKYFRSTASGTEWITLTDLFYDKFGVDTISGSLQTIINNLNIVDLIDMPGYYDEGKYLTSTASGTEWTTISGAVFGTHHYNVCDSATTSTTSTTYIEKVRLDLYNLPAGEYRVGWFYEWSFSSSSSEFNFRIHVDNTTTLTETSTRPAPADITSFRASSGFACLQLTAGDHYVDMDFHSGAPGKTAVMRNARIEVWRVS